MLSVPVLGEVTVEENIPRSIDGHAAEHEVAVGGLVPAWRAQHSAVNTGERDAQQSVPTC